MLSNRFSSNYFFESTSFDGEHYYLKKKFVNDLYFYYINNGYKNIIFKQISNIFTYSFTLFLVVFMINCVNYDKIIDIKEKTTLGEVIYIKNFFNLDAFSWVLLSIFFIFAFVKILNLLNGTISYKRLQSFYNKELNINDHDLINTTWEKILKLMKHRFDNDDVDVYYISNKIMGQDNYMLALIDNDIIQFSYLTRLMEWNLYYCIIQYIYDEESNVIKNINYKNAGHAEKIKGRLQSISIANFILMPFISIILFFYSLFEYCEKFYNKPELINSRNWTLEAKWRLRYYNETYHNFHNRLKDSKKYADDYTDQFHSKMYETISRLIVFVCSAIFTILLLFSLINEKVLLHLYIANGKTTIWFVGILLSVIALFKSGIRDKITYFPNEKLEILKKYFPTLLNSGRYKENKNKFFHFYQFKLQMVLQEIFYTLLVPFELWKISQDSEKIIEFIQENTIRHSKLGKVCKYSVFDNIIGLENEIGDKKTVESFKNFKKNYLQWFENLELSNNMSVSVM